MVAKKGWRKVWATKKKAVKATPVKSADRNPASVPGCRCHEPFGISGEASQGCGNVTRTVGGAYPIHITVVVRVQPLLDDEYFENYSKEAPIPSLNAE